MNKKINTVIDFVLFRQVGVRGKILWDVMPQALGLAGVGHCTEGAGALELLVWKGRRGVVMANHCLAGGQSYRHTNLSLSITLLLRGRKKPQIPQEKEGPCTKDPSETAQQDLRTARSHGGVVCLHPSHLS